MSDQDTGAHGDQAKGGHSGPPTLIVLVEAPRDPDQRKRFDWPQTRKVGEAAREAATAFGYVGGTPGLQTTETPPRQLDNNKPLVAEHVHTNDVLELVDMGGGV